MKKYLIIVVILGLFISVVGCATDRTDKVDDSYLVSVPYSYSFDKTTLDSRSGDLMIPFFSYNNTPDIVNRTIKRAYIQDESGEYLNVSVTQIEMIEAPLTRIKNRSVYGGNVQVDIEFQNATLLYAELILEYEDGPSDRLPVGSIAVADIEGDYDEAILRHVRYAFIHSAPNDNDVSGLAVNSIILEIDAFREVRIKSVDFGVPGLGIKDTGIQAYHGADINRVSKLVNDMKLDQEIPDAYNRRIENNANTSCELDLPVGRSYIVCPLTYQNENQPVIKKVFAKIIFETEDGDYAYPIASFPLYSIFRYYPEQIEELFKQANGR